MIEIPRGLPPPTLDMLNHSEKLLGRLRTEMSQETHACISFARFMELALYEPSLGYYNNPNFPKLGQAGDFVTSPELSPLFARCMATQCQAVLEAITEGVILELGAGTGRMAADLLLELERRECLPTCYKILEVSAELRQRQREYFQQSIPHLSQYIEHLDRLPTQPIRGIILANEVADALPVHKFLLQGDLLQEMYVSWERGHLAWKLAAPSTAPLARALSQLWIDYWQGLDYYESEISVLLPAWINSLSDSLAQGLIVLIDYGFPRNTYYHPSRCSGTVMCHYRHRTHSNPLILVGLQDITASVDFTLVAEAAAGVGLEVLGFVSQAAFLLACDLLELSAVYSGVERLTVNRWIQQLTSPNEMGELVKVLILGRSGDHLLLPRLASYNRQWCL